MIWQHGSPSKQSFLDNLNNQRDSIKFTMEEEQDNSIAFLDVLVRREGQKVSTSVYRKPTHTDRYLNFHSHHHPKVLVGVVRCLRNRAVHVCDPNSIQQEILHLGKTFQANSYPERVLDPILNRNTPQPPQPTAEESTETKILCLPYVRGVTEKIERVCRSIKTVNLKLVTKPHRTIRQTLINVKNRVPEEKRTGVVYEVPCRDCDHVYIGETGRTLKKRLAEHKQAVRRFDEINGIAVHVHQHDHHIDWESARVVGNEMFYWRRRVLEAIKINSHPSTMNLDCGLSLSNLWRPFLTTPT